MSLPVLLPPLQVCPASIEQEEEQPSAETALPSSHASLPALTPSPHTGKQDDEEVDPVEEYVPELQGVHADAPAIEKVLTGHRDLTPDPQVYPASQREHEDQTMPAPVDVHVPAAQAVFSPFAQ